MFMSYISILSLIPMKILGEYLPTQYKLPTTLKPIEPYIEPCQNDNCRPAPDLIGPIVGSICGFFSIVVIIILFTWFYLRKKTEKKAVNQMTRTIKFIEQPSLYTGTISTNDNISRLYEISSSNNDSHYYEKIRYHQSV